MDLLLKGCGSMSAPPHAINLQFGKSAFCYQDVILLPFVSVLRSNPQWHVFTK